MMAEGEGEGGAIIRSRPQTEEEEEKEHKRLKKPEEEPIELAKSLRETLLLTRGYDRFNDGRKILAFTDGWRIRKHHGYDLSNLLTAGIGSGGLLDKNGDLMNFDVLKGKFVLLYFWCNSHAHPTENPCSFWFPIRELEETYKWHQEELAVVLVALGNHEFFELMFSRVPGYAIPHTDKRVKEHLMKTFDIEDEVAGRRALLLSPDGFVVNDNAIDSMITYGSLAFPFSKQSIKTFVDECDGLQYEIFVKKKLPSFTTLLGQHLIFFTEGEERKVLTSDFESGSKIVALYFLEPTNKGYRHTKTLLTAWNSLTAQQRSEFAIVIVDKDDFNISNTMEFFEKQFGLQIPWYRVEVSGRKLCRIFEKYSSSEDYYNINGDGDLVVLKGDKCQQPLSYFAFNILQKYGVKAYPFTMEAAVECSKTQQPFLSEDLMQQYHWDFKRLSTAVSEGRSFKSNFDSESESD